MTREIATYFGTGSQNKTDKSVVMGNFYIQPISHLRDLVALDLDPAHAADAYGSWS